MKKIALLFIFAAAAFASRAQLTLTGSSYSQNFDGLGSGLPTGWFVYNTATTSSLGIADTTYGGSTAYGAYWDTTDCPSDVLGRGFKNCASANNGAFLSTATCIVQEEQTNRALGVRQVAADPGYDSGASFVFKMANTDGDSVFTLSFQLQGLDSSCPRVTTWTLDYGIGAAPTTFIPITTTPAILNTGGKTFTNTAVTASLPAAINKQTGPVCIRLSALTKSTGSGDRTTTAIDNLNLSWSHGSTAAVAAISAQPSLSLTVLGQATSDKVNLAYGVEEDGTYILHIYDMTGRVIYTENINAQKGSQTLTLSGLNFAPGMYIAKMNSSNSSAIARISVQ